MKSFAKILTLATPLLLLTFGSDAVFKPAFAAEANGSGCASFLSTTDDVDTWLLSKTQAELAAAFACLPASNRLPLGVGVGTGSLYASVPGLNTLQQALGSTLWGGKRFYAADGGVRLLNIMRDSGTERYRAAVRLTSSISDHRPTVVLDYRIDDSFQTLGYPASPLQLLVDGIVHGIRDEIREVYLNGKPTNVFLGRAYLARQTVSLDSLIAGDVSLTDDEFQAADSWIFAANFFLDFRSR